MSGIKVEEDIDLLVDKVESIIIYIVVGEEEEFKWLVVQNFGIVMKMIDLVVINEDNVINLEYVFGSKFLGEFDFEVI